MTSDPRVPDLQGGAILTDTQIRLTFAPVREEARVVAAQVATAQARVNDLAVLLQRGAVHIQLKAGFAESRRLIVSPAEAYLLYDALDRFITGLPTVDTEIGKP